MHCRCIATVLPLNRYGIATESLLNCNCSCYNNTVLSIELDSTDVQFPLAVRLRPDIYVQSPTYPLSLIAYRGIMVNIKISMLKLSGGASHCLAVLLDIWQRCKLSVSVTVYLAVLPPFLLVPQPSCQCGQLSGSAAGYLFISVHH